MSKDVSGWVPAAGATVTVVDANGVTHTVTTDEDGYYSFENISVNPNTIVTATVEVDGKTIVLKKVIPDAIAEDEDYDAGTMTPETTALALVVETLVDEGVEPEDIYLGEILGSDSFEELVEQVTTVIEEDGNVTEDPDVTGGAGDIADEIINPPTPPSPPSGPSTVSVTGVTLDQETLTLTAGGDTGTLTATVAPENATNKNITWESSDETIATVSDGVVTPVTVGTVDITVTTEDGEFTATCVVTVCNPEFNGNVSGQIITDESGNVSGTLTGDYSLKVTGTLTPYDANIATFDGTVTGDIEGDISATINAQGIDTLYGIIENTGAVETVRIVGVFGQTGEEGDFAGEIITGEELPAVTGLSITGDDVVAVGDTITLSADITPADATNEVLWSVYVNNREFAEIDEETGELTGLSAGTATVIVKTYDDSNLSFTTKQITIVDGKVINVTQKLGYDTIQAAVDGAEDGDTIFVGSGTYPEFVEVTKSNLTLYTVDAVLEYPNDESAIAIGDIGIKVDMQNLGTITIEGFTVSGFMNGIVQREPNKSGTNLKVINNTVEPAATGQLRNGIQIFGTGSEVSGNTVTGGPFMPGEWAGVGIGIYAASDVTVENNTILGDAIHGISIQSREDSPVMNNIIIKDNSITGAGIYDYSKAAINVASSGTNGYPISNLFIENNTIQRSAASGGDYYGINLTSKVDLSESEFNNNTFSGCDVDIRINPDSAAAPTLTNVTVDGISIFDI
jgi:parallel beta-helix repeat protein